MRTTSSIYPLTTSAALRRGKSSSPLSRLAVTHFNICETYGFGAHRCLQSAAVDCCLCDLLSATVLKRDTRSLVPAQRGDNDGRHIATDR